MVTPKLWITGRAVSAVLLTISLTLASMCRLQAATLTWSGGGGFWTVEANWDPALEPTLADDVFFDSLLDGTGGTVRLEGGASGLDIRSANSITFGAGAGSYMIDGQTTAGPRKDLVIGGGGVSNESSVLQDLNARILINSSQTWTAGGGDIVARDIVQLGGNTLTLDGDQDISIYGVISGTGGIIKDGLGTLNLLGANTYSGTTVLNTGTLLYSASQTLSGPLVLNGGILDANDQVLSFGSLTLGGDSTVRLGTDGTSQSLTFSSGTWTQGSLTIENWSAGPGSDQLGMVAEPSQDLLNNIVFSGYAPGAVWSEGFISPIPEPSTGLLAATGLVMLLVVHRRRTSGR